MSYPQQPGGWSDPTSGPTYVDPSTGQPAYPTSPGAYPGPGGYPGQGGYPPGYVPPQPGYAGYPGYAAPVMTPPQSTNGMAIASLVLSLVGLTTCGVTSLIGAILGHVARRQIRERGEGGDGMALAGIISGWIIFALALLGGTAYVLFIVWAVRNANNLPSTYPS
ncbi:MAG TPA: DUF4190 domain-containing protein [Rugosimonospora sp.]|nr:DUF4190 domain-containing protein [Rugosimonospora sp.]